MNALDRKLLRDLLLMKGQVLAIAAVVACGIAVLVLTLNTLASLVAMKDTYYERYRFADIFANLKRAPNSLIPRIEEVPGVARVQTRVVLDVTIDVEDLAEPATGRLISMPDFGEPALNAVHLRQGRMIDPQRRGEVLVSEVFADAHAMEPGDSVVAIINGRRQELEIVGIALSPEYVFQIRPGDFLPDNKRFGVFWMSYRHLASAYNMEGGFNDIALSLMPDAEPKEVMRRLDDIIAPFGGLGSYDRDQQISYRFLADDIAGLQGMGLIVPTIFLAVAAFLLNVVMTRIIATQREEIAALKAFGYRHLEVGLHYLKMVMLIVVIGTVGGIVAGIPLGRGMTGMYTEFYKFPVYIYKADTSIVAMAALISLGAGIVGAFGAVQRAVSLPPAEAMRPEPPAKYKPTLLERLGLAAFLSQTARMVLRQLERRPMKAALSILGIAMAAAILVMGSFSADAFDYMIDFQFKTVQRQDMSVNFIEPLSSEGVYELKHMPGVMRVEAVRNVPVRIHSGHHSRRLGITGLSPGAELFRLIDANRQQHDPPPEGIMITDKLGRLLDIEIGDELFVEVLQGSRPSGSLPVAGIIQEYSGLAAYMDIRALNCFAHEGRNITGAYLQVDALHTNDLYQTLKSTPVVAGVTLRTAGITSFMETVAESMMMMRMFNIVFAGIIAIGIVYNTARISLSERSRELGTLRVMGFTRAEVSAILLGELAVLTVVAIPVGLLIGYGFVAMIAQSLDTELYTIPLIVYPRTYAMAAITVLVSAVISGLIVRRKIDHFDLVEVLKTKE